MCVCINVQMEFTVCGPHTDREIEGEKERERKRGKERESERREPQKGPQHEHLLGSWKSPVVQ